MRSSILMIVLVVFGSVLLSAGCAHTWTASAERYRTGRLEKYHPPAKTATLQPGDRIQVLLHTPELRTVPVTLDNDGCVTLPFIGSVKILGLSSAEAEAVIRREYVGRKIFKENAIQIGIMASDKVFYVVGHVKRPGALAYSRDITISMAISMAEGRDQFADPNVIWLTQGGRKRKLDNDKDANVTFVNAYDIIEVPRGWL